MAMLQRGSVQVASRNDHSAKHPNAWNKWGILAFLGFAWLIGIGNSQQSLGGVIYSNLGSPIEYEGGAGFTVRGNQVYNDGMNYLVTHIESAVQFQVGGTQQVAFGSAAVYLKGGSNAPYINYFKGSFDVRLYADDSGKPGNLLEQVRAIDVNTNPGNPVLYPAAPQIVVNASGNILLSPGSRYWVGIEGVGSSSYNWFASRRQGGHYASATRSGLGGGTTYGAWGTDVNPTFAPNIVVFSGENPVPGSNVPEPASGAVILGLLGLAGMTKRVVGKSKLPIRLQTA